MQIGRVGKRKEWEKRESVCVWGWGGVLEVNILLECQLMFEGHKRTSGLICGYSLLLPVLLLFGEEVMVWKTVWVVV